MKDLLFLIIFNKQQNTSLGYEKISLFFTSIIIFSISIFY